MKYFISHRGNTHGKNPEMENNPEFIMKAIAEGFDVEIDVWVIDDKIYLGHDNPQYSIDIGFLFNDKLWCHAKNFAALALMTKYKDRIHYFSHDKDNHILTSKSVIWAYTGKEINEDTICVLPENCKETYTKEDLMECLGICSDEIFRYRVLYNKK